MTMRAFVHHGKVVNYITPVDANGVGIIGGDRNGISLRNYQGAFWLLTVGAHSSTAVAVTMQQMKNVEASGAKALAFTEYYSNTVGASPQEESDMWVAKTASSNTFNIAANTNYIIPIRPGMLDVTNNFDCVRLHLGAPGAATLVAAVLVLHDGPMGITDNTSHIPSAKVNRMPN